MQVRWYTVRRTFGCVTSCKHSTPMITRTFGYLRKKTDGLTSRLNPAMIRDGDLQHSKCLKTPRHTNSKIHSYWSYEPAETMNSSASEAKRSLDSSFKNPKCADCFNCIAVTRQVRNIPCIPITYPIWSSNPLPHRGQRSNSDAPTRALSKIEELKFAKSRRCRQWTGRR